MYINLHLPMWPKLNDYVPTSDVSCGTRFTYLRPQTIQEALMQPTTRAGRIEHMHLAKTSISLEYYSEPYFAISAH